MRGMRPVAAENRVPDIDALLEEQRSLGVEGITFFGEMAVHDPENPHCGCSDCLNG